MLPSILLLNGKPLGVFGHAPGRPSTAGVGFSKECDRLLLLGMDLVTGWALSMSLARNDGMSSFCSIYQPLSCCDWILPGPPSGTTSGDG